MKIKQKLLIGIILAICVLGFIGKSIYQSIQEVSYELVQTEVAEQILKDRISRRTLLLEYIAYREERPKEQWRLLSEKIKSSSVENSAVFDTADKNVIQQIYESSLLIDALFEQLVLHHEQGQEDTIEMQLLASEFEKTLSAQIETESLVNTQLAQQLVVNSLANIKNAQKELLASVILSATGLLVFLTLLFLSFNSFIAAPIQRLTAVTKRFTSGHLHERVESLSSDEIGQLGTAFNVMAEKLEEMYVGLEQKVKDRTRDLEESKNQFATLSERFMFATQSAKIGVWEFNVQDNTLTWDNQMYKLYGIKKRDFSGVYDAWLAGVHPDDKEQQEKEMKLALEGKKDFNTTFRIVWPSGEERIIRAYAAVERDAKKKALRMVGVNWDVTKEMEVDKAKSEFVSLASHQLRTPLSTINWYAEMLESGDAGPLNKKQKEFLKEIYIGSQRMVTLVNSLLNVSRLELGRLSVNLAPTNLPKLAKTLISELKPHIEKNHLTVNEKYEKKLPKAIIDPKLISIVFQNLLTNAVKYTKAKGVIDFSIELKKAKDNVRGRKVVQDSFLITVKDTGIGIPEAQQKLLFSKLFRADNARERDQDGTGLGLYIVKEIVDLSKGEIWFVSKTGEGTAFFLLLPVVGMEKNPGKLSLQ